MLIRINLARQESALICLGLCDYIFLLLDIDHGSRPLVRGGRNIFASPADVIQNVVWLLEVLGPGFLRRLAARLGVDARGRVKNVFVSPARVFV